jgi:glycerol-3-phosphate acyltransferase PlsY
METLYTILLAIGAFWLGACPFSLWVGKWILRKDIRDYGDANPGAANIFIAGGRKAGFFAGFLDTAKGVPFVALSYYVFGLPSISALAVALCAILGNAFSPVLRLRGGKSLAITFGVLFAIPQHEILIVFIIFMIVSSLLLVRGLKEKAVNSWSVILGTTLSFIYILATTGRSWESLFMLGVLTVFIMKRSEDLRAVPKQKDRLMEWLQSRRLKT